MDIATAPRRQFARYWVGCLGWLLAGPVAAQPLFTDVTEQVGLDAFPGEEARNVAFVDYDNDGFQDLFITENRTYGRRIGLFHNTGDGRFEDQTFRVPADLHRADGRAGAIFGDYDNDGDEDLFLPVFPHNVLLRNDCGLFTRVDAGSDLTDSLFTDSAIWLDYDQDGYLDLYVTSNLASEDYAPRANRLFHNQGDETFTDQTAAAGLDIFLDPDSGGTMGGMAAGDFNDDGWSDLYIGVLGHPNRLFLNDGQGGFRDATSGEIGDEGEAFSISVGDIDNDGDLDIFQPAGGLEELGFRSLMLMNVGNGQFLDVTESVGLGVGVLGTHTAGTAFADVDNDGDLDLVVGLSIKDSVWENFLLLNDGTGVFVDQTAASGIEDNGAYTAVGDYDEDGFLDLLYSSFTRDLTALYRNNGNANHWLRVELVGIESNRSGIGARLLATSGDLEQMREILGGVGRQEDERVAHFGLGDRTRVDSLEIRWPSGQVDMLTDIPADQKIRLFEGRKEYHTITPTMWVTPLPDSLVAGGIFHGTVAVRPALFEPEARITGVVADLREMGGGEAVPLQAAGDGTWRVETTLNVTEAYGIKRVSVMVDQSTSVGDYWTQLTHRQLVLPATDLSVFAEGLHDGWTVRPEWLRNLTRHPASDVYPTWSPDGSRIAFRTGRDGNDEIYVMNADGSDPANLTNDPGSDGNPSWSPDGSRIAFRSERDGNFDVYVMNADGTDLVRLTNNPGYDGSASWSPDGQKIAFATYRDDKADIYVMEADGSDPVNLTNDWGFDDLPVWSPDGTRIAFQSYRDGNYEIYVMNADGSNLVNLTNHLASDTTPSWSPDGTRIAFRSQRDGHREVYVMNADGSNLVNLTNHPAEDATPVWSPDGSRLVFATDRGNPHRMYELYVMEVGHTERVNVQPTATTGFGDLTSLQVRTDETGAWRVLCQPSSPLDITGYRALHFAFHPGDTRALESPSLRVGTRQGEIDLLAGVSEDMQIDLEMRDWQEVELPLELLDIEDPIAAIAFSGNLAGTFYLADIRLVTAAQGRPGTAVTEEQVGLPGRFALEQNFPNPFNSATMMRFALPGNETVELEVFNLMGQKVATLMEGVRPAGTYRMRWDGRDDDGRPLASGVYLYRLRTGDGRQMETRKLVLIR